MSSDFEALVQQRIAALRVIPEHQTGLNVPPEVDGRPAESKKSKEEFVANSFPMDRIEREIRLLTQEYHRMQQSLQVSESAFEAVQAERRAAELRVEELRSALSAVASKA